jgi:hypothetical protein
VLVCTPGGKEATLLALNRKDGAVVWKSAVPGGEIAGYASVVAVSHTPWGPRALLAAAWGRYSPSTASIRSSNSGSP